MWPTGPLELVRNEWDEERKRNGIEWSEIGSDRDDVGPAGDWRLDWIGLDWNELVSMLAWADCVASYVCECV